MTVLNLDAFRERRNQQKKLERQRALDSDAEGLMLPFFQAIAEWSASCGLSFCHGYAPFSADPDRPGVVCTIAPVMPSGSQGTVPGILALFAENEVSIAHALVYPDDNSIRMLKPVLATITRGAPDWEKNFRRELSRIFVESLARPLLADRAGGGAEQPPSL